jgi:hypothetical protein
MAIMQQVGFSQRIQLSWLEYTAQLVHVGKTRDEINAALQEHLRDKLSVGHQVQRGNREKAITILLKVWQDLPLAMRPLRDRGLEFICSRPLREHLALHWGMSMAVYPFFGGVAEVVGKLLRLQDQIGTAQVQRRIREQLGERETVARAARRVYRSFIDWKTLVESGTKGVYQRTAAVFISDPNLSAWMTECVLHANNGGWCSLSALDGHAALYPFVLNASWRDVLRNRHDIEFTRHGVDQEMVRIK